jgi:hypothetical protein
MMDIWGRKPLFSFTLLLSGLKSSLEDEDDGGKEWCKYLLCPLGKRCIGNICVVALLYLCSSLPTINYLVTLFIQYSIVKHLLSCMV